MGEAISYTPEEVAKILKITRFTVYELVKRGDLAAYRIGRKVRIEQPDLDAYIRKSKGLALPAHTTADAFPDVPRSLTEGFIICGQDVILDILTRHLEKNLPNGRFLRNYSGSMDGLLSLYRGTAHAVTAHLWDGDTDTYNVPYVRRLLPGYRTLVFNLAFRTEGFYVANGNPKHIRAWEDLAKPGVRIVNREPGSGARVFLDEKLRSLDISQKDVVGYEQEENSHLAVASCVARGEADVGLGIEKAAMQVKELDFIPLQKERYDLIIKKEDADKPPFKALVAVLQSKAFRNEVQGMGGYDLSLTGELVGET